MRVVLLFLGLGGLRFSLIFRKPADEVSPIAISKFSTRWSRRYRKHSGKPSKSRNTNLRDWDVKPIPVIALVLVSA